MSDIFVFGGLAHIRQSCVPLDMFGINGLCGSVVILGDSFNLAAAVLYYLKLLLISLNNQKTVHTLCYIYALFVILIYQSLWNVILYSVDSESLFDAMIILEVGKYKTVQSAYF